jgi:hypothetical protein
VAVVSLRVATRCQFTRATPIQKGVSWRTLQKVTRKHRAVGRRSPRCSVVAFVVASVIVSNTPDTSNSPPSILVYYKVHNDRISVGAFLVAPAVVIGLFWFAYLRNWLQRRDVHERWGAVAFAGGILFAVTLERPTGIEPA